MSKENKLLRLRAYKSWAKNEKLKEFVHSGIFSVKTLDAAQVVLAGGAIRSFITNEDPNDFDVFIIGDSPSLKQALLKFCDERFTSVFKCPQEMLFTYKTPFGKLQIICPKIYNSVAELMDSFDFTACRAVFTGNELYTYRSFIRSVKKKVLELHKVSLPLATMGRIYKYKSYGYNIYKATEDFIRSVREDDFVEQDLFRHYID